LFQTPDIDWPGMDVFFGAILTVASQHDALNVFALA
jgi:hypothetical protein